MEGRKLGIHKHYPQGYHLKINDSFLWRRRRCCVLRGCCQREAAWPLGLRESTLFINSQVNMLLWPKAATHFHLSKEPGLPGATMSPACEMGSSQWKYSFCGIWCLFLSVCSHEDFDYISPPKFCPLGVLSLWLTFLLCSLRLLLSRSSSLCLVSSLCMHFFSPFFQSPRLAFHLLPCLVFLWKTLAEKWNANTFIVF